MNATISVTEREWRPRALQFTSLFSYIRRQVDIEFDQEVGHKKGSWKGGVTGCSWDIKKDETPLECLQRMEAERDFAKF